MDWKVKSIIICFSTATCQSQLAPHRVIPYHYKGMSKE